LPARVVTVIGTRFRTTATRGETRVQVEEGRVELTRTSDGKSVAIAAGQYAIAAANTELVALPIVSSRAAQPIVLYRFDEGRGTTTRLPAISQIGIPITGCERSSTSGILA
jgi:hypothetical protein